MDALELALAVFRSKGLDETDAVLRKAVAYSIINGSVSNFDVGRFAMLKGKKMFGCGEFD